MLKISRVFLPALVATLGTFLCMADELSLKLTSPETLQKRLRMGLVHENERESAVQALFLEAGCTAALQPVHKSVDNVICVLPGETQSTIIVGGHYDFRTEGQGIVDDWSGTALLASLYETLKDRPHKHTFKFVAFAAEEAGLVGSIHFTKKMTVEEKNGTRAFVNLECLGLTAPVGDDDTHPFRNSNIPVISIHSVTSETLPILHSKRDNILAVQMDDYHAAYRLVVFYLAYLDNKLLP